MGLVDKGGQELWSEQLCVQLSTTVPMSRLKVLSNLDHSKYKVPVTWEYKASFDVS